METILLFRKRWVIWVAGVGLAGLADWLFYERPVGWTLAGFVLVLAILLVGREAGLRRRWAGRGLVVLVMGMGAALVEEPSLLAVIMMGLSLGMMVMAGDEMARRRAVGVGRTVGDWIAKWIYLLATVWFRWVMDSAIGRRWLKRHPGAEGRVMGAAGFIAWWILPVGAGAVFLGLFAIANPIVESWVRTGFDKLWTVMDWLPEYLRPGRVFLWGAVASGAYGLMRYRGQRMVRREVAVPPVQRWKDFNWLTSAGMIVRCLVVFNLVFGMETALDVVYLFGGAGLPAGMTYKEYAHRGAYPLIATALLTGLFVLVTFQSGGPAQRSVWARRLVYLWIGQNLLLMASTIWRLRLYVDVDGLTRLRVATIIWLALVGAGFGWVIFKIVRGWSNAWLWRVNGMTAFAVLYGCAFVNFDGMIAGYNVRHCAEASGSGPAIDMDYLRDLGPASLPALGWLREHDGKDAGRIDPLAAELHGKLAGELSDWRGWTWRRWREAPEDMREDMRTAAR